MRKVRDLLRQRRVISIALVTLLTLGLVGVVVAATTSVGCSFTKSLAVKAKQCATTSVAIVVSPSPTARPSAFQPIPSPDTPYDPGTSSNPPFNPGATSYPPFHPAASPGYPPSPDYYPPLAGPASGSNFPGIALTCRLPVFAGGPGSGGFIAFPGGTFVADPRSAVTAPSPSPGSASPTPPPYGGNVGWWGTTYDAKYSKWLPVPYAWVSPDGSRYAYPLNGDIYVQSVSGGGQLELGQGRQFSVLDVENDGVYVVAAPNPGLWFLPYSGAARQITASGFWQAASHGAAYGTATSAVPQGATNTILKLDLSSGSATPFFSTVSAQSQVTGFDAQGHPIIQVFYINGVAIFIATGPNTATVMAAQTHGTYSPPPFPQGTPIADAHGIWYQAGNGIVLFANGAWYPMSNIGGQLAGQCL
jgi:hypothetical protein